MNKKETNKMEDKHYISPDFEVVLIEFEQNILDAGSGGSGINDFDDGGDL